jgi:hypothetical protein
VLIVPKTSTMSDLEERTIRLRKQGCCVVPSLLPCDLISELTRVTEALLAQQTPEEIERFRYQGSNIKIDYQDPVFARLIAYPPTLQALRELGADDLKFFSAHLLSKAPGAPALYWHQDWWAWDEPSSGSEQAPQLFVMVYLTDTTRENGCLRVLPGTHRRRIPLHALLPPAHTDLTYEATSDTPLFMHHPDEVDVPVRAGDVVIGDARLLHAAHPNRSAQRRTCLTLWYTPSFHSLTESIQARMARKDPLQPPTWWEEEVGRPVEPLIAHYAGTAEPATWNRTPGIHLPG